MCVCVCVCLCLCLPTCARMLACMHLCVCMYLCIHVFDSCMYVSMYLCVHMFMYVFTPLKNGLDAKGILKTYGCKSVGAWGLHARTNKSVDYTACRNNVRLNDLHRLMHAYTRTHTYTNAHAHVIVAASNFAPVKSPRTLPSAS